MWHLYINKISFQPFIRFTHIIMVHHPIWVASKEENILFMWRERLICISMYILNHLAVRAKDMHCISQKSLECINVV